MNTDETTNVNEETIDNEGTDTVQDNKPKRATRKSNAPSDKTVIKNLRAELKAMQARLEELEAQNETAVLKAEHYFQKHSKLVSAVDRKQRESDQAINALINILNGALGTYQALIRKDV